MGVASADQLLDAHGGTTIPAMLVVQQMERAAKAVEALHGLLDRNPEEVSRSEEADAASQREIEGARVLLDLWVAEPLGLAGARAELWAAAEAIGEVTIPALAEPAAKLAEQHRVLHWPLAFPEIFANGRGFDAVVGNPPWEEITVEELAFYARYQPGLRALPEDERTVALERLKTERPELAERLIAELHRAAAMRTYFASDTGYTGGAGDPDLYKFFCQRYRSLLTTSATLAVVLPRGAFLAKGSADFRRWLFGESTVERVDFLLNNRRWMFDTHPQYTVALLVAHAIAPRESSHFEVAGVASSLAAFVAQSASAGIALNPSALGAELEVPLLPTQAAADLLARLRHGDRFPAAGARWACFSVRELDETQDSHLWQGATEGRELWKGESYEQYDPIGRQLRICPTSDDVMRVVRKKRPGLGSLLADVVPEAQRIEAVRYELDRARVVYRRVTRATDSRTIIGCLLPPNIFIAYTAPYLAFTKGDERDQAACLAIMNSLAFDFQARRYVELSISFTVLESLRLPDLDDETYQAIVIAAARLSCPDERFSEFALATGVEVGPLTADERDALRAEIDARVAHAWRLDRVDLETIFADFTIDAVPDAYRQRVRDRFAELSPGD
jgi:hypothetical protein